MNKIRGSIIAKIIAWLLLIISGVLFIGSCIAVVVMEDYNVFGMSQEEVLENEFAELSDRYSMIAIANLHDGLEGKNEQYFANKAFRYGIIEKESLEGLNLNQSNTYIERNFTEAVKEEDLHQFSITLSEKADIWYSDELFGGWGSWDSGNDYQTLYADRICYDMTGGIFYYRADNKYYPVQNVSLMISEKIDDNTYLEDYYTFIFNNETKKYANLYAAEANSEVWQEVVEETTDEPEITFDMFDGTAIGYTEWTDMIFDGIRPLQGSELLLIDSEKIPHNSFVEVEDAFLDDYYTLHVLPKGDAKDYLVVSYIDESLLERNYQIFLNGHETEGLDDKLALVLSTKNADLYVLTEVFVDTLYKMKQDIVPFLFGMLILAVISFGFLVSSAGHRRKAEEIVPTFIDKIPLDVLSVAVFFIEGIGVSFIVQLGDLDAMALMIPLGVGIGIIMACLLVMTLLSFAVRIKLGKWWRNSITYWIFEKIRNLCVMMWKNIGILWKVVVAGCVFATIVILIGFCMFGAEPEVVVFVFLEVVILCLVHMLCVLQFRKLQDGGRMIAEGDLQYKIDTNKMFWEFKKHADSLNRISEGMSHAVDERMKSERFKTELITNVSHDIKTPLTSIINYVDLLEKTDIQDETAKEYLEVLERQSARLKKLIEDLIEASKASTGNLSVSMEELEANVFVTQILGEFEGKIANAGLELIIDKPEEEIPVCADGRHLWRVVDNLMNNICKYAQPGSRVYINLEQTADKTLLTFRNMSKYPLNITSEELMERFVRGDSSRNTEGNGLGLSIARSLMELMNGKLSLYVDGDLFKVVLEFPR